MSRRKRARQIRRAVKDKAKGKEVKTSTFDRCKKPSAEKSKAAEKAENVLEPEVCSPCPLTTPTSPWRSAT